MVARKQLGAGAALYLYVIRMKLNQCGIAPAVSANFSDQRSPSSRTACQVLASSQGPILPPAPVRTPPLPAPRKPSHGIFPQPRCPLMGSGSALSDGSSPLPLAGRLLLSPRFACMTPLDTGG